MRIIRGLKKPLTGKCVLALGMFDGVHRGHRALLAEGRRLALAQELPFRVCTFLTHPLAVIAPERCPPMLESTAWRAARMAACGVDELILQPFSRRFADIPAETFIERAVRVFSPTDIVVGFNYTFGAGGRGDTRLLEAAGEKLGFRAHVVPPVAWQGEPVSSTRVRELVLRGDVARAAELLTRPHHAQARVADNSPDGMSLRFAPRSLMPPAGLYRVAFAAVGREGVGVLEIGGRETPENGAAQNARLLSRMPLRVPRGVPLTVWFLEKL